MRAWRKGKSLQVARRLGPGIVELETLLSSIPAIAPESGGQGEMRKAEALVGWLGSKAYTRSSATTPPIRASREARGPTSSRPSRARRGRLRAGRIWIMSHLDVVPEGDRSMWRTDPF